MALVTYSAEETLRLKRRNDLIDALATRRNADDSDVILVCDENELYAHKCVLEASSPYFAAMFRSGMGEAISKRVVFKDLELETLSAILDFIYTGAVLKLKPYQQLKKVLGASDLLNLQDLFQYCCDTLASRLTVENFFDIFDVTNKYKVATLQEKVLQFWKSNSTQLFALDQFVSLNGKEVKDLLSFLRSKGICLDEPLRELVKWLRHNLEVRDEFTDELFDCIDDKLVTLACVKSMLKAKEVMPSSVSIAKRLQKLAVEILISDGLVIPVPAQPTLCTRCRRNLSYCCSQCVRQGYNY